MLTTSVVGSHGLPGWVWLAREALEAERLGQVDLAELIEDATLVALADQERAGVEVVSTGEMGRVRFIIGFYDRLAGIRTLEPPRKLGVPNWDTNTPFEVTDTVSAPAGLGIVEEFTLARTLTNRPMKATVPGPFTLMIPLRLGGPYRDRESLLADLVVIVRDELEALVAAGADFIQIDEPNYAMLRSGLPDIVTVFNRTIQDIQAKFALHVCFGNLYGRPFPAVRSYAHLFPAIYDVRAEQLVLEYANRGMADVELLRDFPPDKELGAGVVDVKAFRVESADDVAQRIRPFLRYVKPDKLWINPDCGLWETPRRTAAAKLRAMVEGTRIVRKEVK
ncbi:MAG: cobalamin-independent methionine synthase II family protein [Candidatus Rokubacteria bacterium]|nr:cobalamin-independent methionine synthase II family protein [Candidatus Rokubacteria bacterium]